MRTKSTSYDLYSKLSNAQYNPLPPPQAASSSDVGQAVHNKSFKPFSSITHNSDGCLSTGPLLSVNLLSMV